MPFSEQITESHHLICEGPDDIGFFSRLVRSRIIADIHVACGRDPTRTEDNRCLGTSGFIHRINALKSLPAPLPPTRGLLIATDGDSDPAAAFDYACEQLEVAGLPLPTSPYEISNERGRIKTAVMIVPGPNRQGGLESLILECCTGLFEPETVCIDAFCGCLNARNLPEKDRHKLRLRALIAAVNPSDPSLGINS